MSYNPHIGELDRKIQIIQLIKTQSLTGSSLLTDTVIAKPFAKMFEVSGSENIEGKIRHSTNRNYVIRYNKLVKELNSQLILIDDGVRYNIEHVKTIGRKKHLELAVNDYE